MLSELTERDLWAAAFTNLLFFIPAAGNCCHVYVFTCEKWLCSMCVCLSYELLIQKQDKRENLMQRNVWSHRDILFWTVTFKWKTFLMQQQDFIRSPLMRWSIVWRYGKKHHQNELLSNSFGPHLSWTFMVLHTNSERQEIWPELLVPWK